jgi:CPA2 family monovalent cation:H+ antiporter-2
MLSAFRDRGADRPFGHPSGVGLLLSRLATIGLLGVLSSEFFPALFTLVATVLICGGLFVFFRKQIESYYQWMENQFQSGFQAGSGNGTNLAREKLAPWDAHLVEIKVPSRSFLIGNNLLDLQLREKYGLNVVVVVRDGENIVAPKASEILYPGDLMLCFATDEEIDRFRSDIQIDSAKEGGTSSQESYDLRRFMIRPSSQFSNVDIKTSGIHAKYDCIVVGLERGGKRVPSPKSETVLAENDVLWIVGERSKLGVLAQVIG